MSVFFLTSNKNSDAKVRLTRYFDYATKGALRSAITEKNMELGYYAETKKLDDIHIRDDHTGSWILLVGMPILDNNDARTELLNKFFQDPIKTLNNDIDGHYCLFAFDARSSKLYVATDSSSFIPVFYHAGNGAFIISSSELALANAITADVDQLGFVQSISLGVTWGTQTRFQGIRKLDACDLMTIDSHCNHSIKKYWRPENGALWDGSEDNVAQQWIDVVKLGLSSMVKQAGDVPVTADITGGEDSRIVLALCHFLGIQVSTARVRGFEHSSDVRIAKEISQRLKIPLDIELYRPVDVTDLENRVVDVSLSTDGYGSIFPALTRHFTDECNHGPREERSLHLCGMPGGEVYRGSYYSRAKLLAPAHMKTFDVKFFIRMKFLLDHLPELYAGSNDDFLEAAYAHIGSELDEVKEYPAGIKVDHLLRKLQTCPIGLTLRRPFYLPLGLREITKTIYSVSPKLKRGGRLTKACTELMYPELAWIKTQNGVPTVKRTIGRSYLFIPQYYSKFKAVAAGVQRRIFHLNQDSSKLNLRHLSNYHAQTIKTLLTEGQTGEWFRSPDTMKTGFLYNPDSLLSLLNDARNGRCNYIDTLGRIINAELSVQFIYGSLR